MGYPQHSGLGMIELPVEYDKLGDFDLSSIFSTVENLASNVENVARGISTAASVAQTAQQKSGGLFQPTAADIAAKNIDRATVLSPGISSTTLLVVGGLALFFFMSRR